MAERKQDRGVRGALRKTFVAKRLLSRSSSPEPRDTGSRNPNFNPSSTTLSGLDETPPSSSNFRILEFDSSAKSNGSSPGEREPLRLLRFSEPTEESKEEGDWNVLRPARDGHREVMLMIHYSTYGTEDQAVKTSRDMLRTLEVKGANILYAKHDDQEIEPSEP